MSDVKLDDVSPTIDALVVTEARRLCRTHCRAKFCDDANRCLDIWPGPGGQLAHYFKEAHERVAGQDDG
jgi:hypothetical protein